MRMGKGKTAAICLVLAGSMWIAGCKAETRRAAESEVSEPESISLEKYELPEAEKREPKPRRILLEAAGSVCEVIPAWDGSMDILVPAEFVKEAMGIHMLKYPDSRLLLQQGGISVELKAENRGRGSYIPLGLICERFGYKWELAWESRKICLKDGKPYSNRSLPSSYDYRRVGRNTKVRDQGSYGTCWSFAALTALETALRPEDSKEFSADHMSLHNSFSLNQREGGEYTMSMAYLLAWQGPVLEAEDPYGDGISPENLNPAVHVQEIQILPSKDYEAIKKAVFFNGGVQSSLYTSITDSQSRSIYYNEETNAYCYQGNQIPNHDIVIVGWDDHYPKENFQAEVQGDGAFLCVSSWGEAFGDGGYFYVSYYDSNIGSSNLAYTKIEGIDHYDRIYQSDLCGWVGQVGYGKEKAYGANVYRAEAEEELKAVGFYAVGADTSYTIYVSRQTDGEPDFEDKYMVAQGTIAYSGFYTIPLAVPEKLEQGERFAVILEVETLKEVHPLAVEYQADHATADVDVNDGESYISPDGVRWEPMESRYQCNLCLKAYTKG